MMKYSTLLFIFTINIIVAKPSNTPCTWDSKTGASFDLRPLKVTDSTKESYAIIDGDIPCTPETEPSYGYVWNFCADVTSTSWPAPCAKMGKSAVVLQWAQYSETDIYCYSLAHFENEGQLTYDLLDSQNPALGVSISYPGGDKCSATNGNGILRKATVDVYCDNVNEIILSAQEPSLCSYHLSMKSYYGCPKECPVTANGLCDSHGHCAYDSVNKAAYCYCNSGYTGSSCNSKSTSQVAYDGFSVQIGLLVTLLIIALTLTGGVIYMAYRVTEYRKEQINNNYKTLPGESEMVETVNF
eukprot:gene13006-17436_t